MATHYEYKYYKNDSVPLHIIRTHASNIVLRNLYKDFGETKHLAAAGYVGVNGCWFNADRYLSDGTIYTVGNKALLNIAVQDGEPLGISAEDASEKSGATNGRCGRGAIAWNTAWVYSYEELADYNTLDSSFKQEGAWIQGGIALRLGYSNWLATASAQYADSTYFSENAYRTAMVSDHSNCKIHLIVADKKVTPAVFRAAIQEYLGITDSDADHYSYRGIMLDGGNSSTMAVTVDSKQYVYPSNLLRRELTQVVTMKNTNS